MKVYPLLATAFDRYGHRDLAVVVDVFSSLHDAFNYAVMIAEADIKYGKHIPDLEQNQPAYYDGNEQQGYLNVYDENGGIVEEFSLWAETVRPIGWRTI